MRKPFHFFAAGTVALGLLAAVSPALAGGEGSAKKPTGEIGSEMALTNPAAVAFNRRNNQAVHAGPGAPIVGSVYVPPSKVEKKSGGH
ncbi:MAG: hypothetical protein HY246_05295 [Proteobacteria bacterium]|jgi:hypothetical protein|nr:hypothetical protein [Pseudomonadota bacterium]